jgi:hypothetical protein
MVLHQYLTISSGELMIEQFRSTLGFSDGDTTRLRATRCRGPNIPAPGSRKACHGIGLT